MEEENITFSGIEASKIDISELNHAVYLLNRRQRDIPLDHIVFNCDKDEFLNKLGIEKRGLIINNKISNLFGVRVYQRKYVPLNEVWMCDKNGKIIKKFSI